MKRITIYSVSGEKLFSGNASDLPFDDAEIKKEAESRYGDKTCPQRTAAVKQTMLALLFGSAASGDMITVSETQKRFLRHKTAYKISVYED